MLIKEESSSTSLISRSARALVHSAVAAALVWAVANILFLSMTLKLYKDVRRKARQIRSAARGLPARMLFGAFSFRPRPRPRRV
ncbi:hypothetical protein BC828DRAFT_417351 [Blastocladiella britannica]|nr:hypothetical protein BC828DRAFT_417351 [Blastocladiella britannica]